jgi:protein-S-isoprenylcysteine O-methyltransferase Ste14
MKTEIMSVAGSAPTLAGEGADVPASADMSPLTREQIVCEVAMRLLAVLVFSIFVASAMHQFIRDPSRISLLLLAVSEMFTLGLALCTRVPRERDWNPLTVIVSVCASFYFLTFSLSPGMHLLPEKLSAALQVVGMLIQLGAKFHLRRSFGILPANRGIVVSGPYRFLRHPIYFGYFVNQAGFLLSNFGVQNLAVLVVLWLLQAFRVIREELVLMKDAEYRDYAARVRYRFLPGVF